MWGLDNVTRRDLDDLKRSIENLRFDLTRQIEDLEAENGRLKRTVEGLREEIAGLYERLGALGDE